MPALILVLGVGCSFLVYSREHVADQERVHNALDLRVEWRTRDIQNKILDASVPVEALSIFIASQIEIDATEFHRFALQSRNDDPVARLTWAPWVTPNKLTAFEALAKNSVQETGADGLLVRAGQRNGYLPVLFEEQFEKRPGLLGFDFMSEPIRRATVERARDEGRPIATPPVPPVTRLERNPSYTLFWPVYEGGNVPASVDARRTTLLGFVTGSFRVNEIFEFAIRDTPDVVETFSLFINQQADKPYGTPVTLYNIATQRVEVGQVPLGQPTSNGLRLVRSFSLFGQDWTLVFDFPPDFVAGLGSSTRWRDLAIGLLLTLLLTIYVAFELRHRLAIEARVVERTRDLRRTTDQLQTIMEASPHAIVCLDPERRVIIWNRSAEQTFGYRPDEVIGRPFPLVLPEERQEFESRLKRIVKGGVLHNLESRRRRKDGTVIETSSSAAAFYDSAGVLQGTIFAIEDATERNQVQRQLIQAQKLETVGQLTGGLAHDFNNILGVIIGNLELAEEHARPNSLTASYRKKALAAAMSAAELVKRLLAFSRRQPLRPEPTDISAVIATVVPILTRTLGEQVRIESKLQPDLWPATSNAAQLESAMLNLAINARDAMPEGGLLSIEAANTTVDRAISQELDGLKPGDYVVLAVSDTGTGISPEVLSRVIEPFFTTKAPGAGSGLGLSMVFGTMKQFGGTAKIYSEVGMGTTVRLYLPRSGQVVTSAQTQMSDAAAATGHERVLMVEDNDQIRAVGLEILQGLGYQVTTAISGDDAIEQLKNGDRFDLLFSDIVMPGHLNGIALAREMRIRDPSIGILLTSGFTNPLTLRKQIDELGASLIVKPYRKIDLANQVRSILDEPTRSAA